VNATFSVVMPTCGRPALTAAISSVVDQLEDGDELIVVGDGEQDVSAGTVGDFQPASLFYVETQRPGSVFGNHQRDFGMQLALGRSSHLLFLDDDDVYVHGALDVIRSKISESSFAHIFRATWGPGHHWHGTLWAEREVRESNIATPMCVLPNRPYFKSWMDFNDRGKVSDFGFLSAAIGECDGVCWHDDLVATVRP
jgi:glycosyltransferase involved in cell wall biosynthesis